MNFDPLHFLDQLSCLFILIYNMAREQNKNILHFETNLRRRVLFFLLVTTGISPALPSSGKTKSKNPFDEKRLLEQNKRIQKENNAPEDFPNFVREGLSFPYC